MSINSKIFDTSRESSTYTNQPLFLGDDSGLFDTVNKRYPKIWALYKEMKSLDWSEDEFDYSQCLIDFKNCSPDTSELMIKTLAWQWEADSIASRSIIQTLAPIVSSSELWAAYQRVSDNEVVHAATYSEIVRMSFDKPSEVVKNILELKDTFTRLESVSEVFENSRVMSLKYALGEIDKNDPILYDSIIELVCTTLMLERIQFMASFAITFSICGTGLFQPIGKAVQKIAQDELEVHVELSKEVLKIEKKTQRGNDTLERLKPKISLLLADIIKSEIAWAESLFKDGKSIIGVTEASLVQWILFCAKDVATFLDLNSAFKFPRTNPKPYMETWLNMNKTQSAPQEQDLAAYKVGAIINDDNGSTFETDF